MSYIDLLVAMKKNAPTLFEHHVELKSREIHIRLEELRNLYKRADENKDTEEMRRIEKRATELKKELAIYQTIGTQDPLL